MNNIFNDFFAIPIDINIINTIESMLEELQNNTNIFNMDNSEENIIHLDIVFETNDHLEENINYFKYCKDIDDKICKSVKIKKNDDILGTSCLICMDEYKEGTFKRLLPKCKHCFHKKCIDKWLKKNASCPVCRDILL
jgi:cysteinyl-tRNA synthetase